MDQRSHALCTAMTLSDISEEPPLVVESRLDRSTSLANVAPGRAEVAEKEYVAAAEEK